MKSFFVFFVLIIFNQNIFSQETEQESFSVLSYKPEIPDSSSYQILKNLSNAPIEEKILMQVNFHRRDKDFIWIVSKEVEILIYSESSNNQ